MKLLKKLLAAALVGVMALTLLAGCAGSVNESELVDSLNDLHFLSYLSYDEPTGVETIVKGDSNLAKQVLSNIKSYAATHPNDTDSIYSYFYDYEEFDRDNISILPKDTNDIYYYAFLRLDEFQSEEFQKNRTYYIAQQLNMRGFMPLNKSDRALAYSDTATASIATDKFGDSEYLVIVFVQKATGPSAQ